MENYESLAKGLEDIRIEVERLKQIAVGGQVYDIMYFLGGDWKFLVLCTGIDSAMSTYSCIWCKCPKSDRCDNYGKDVVAFWILSRVPVQLKKPSDLVKSKRSSTAFLMPPFPTIPLNNGQFTYVFESIGCPYKSLGGRTETAGCHRKSQAFHML